RASAAAHARPPRVLAGRTRTGDSGPAGRGLGHPCGARDGPARLHCPRGPRGASSCGPRRPAFIVGDHRESRTPMAVPETSDRTPVGAPYEDATGVRRPLHPDTDPFYTPPGGFEYAEPGTVLRVRSVSTALFGLI